jgi:hypothetical protein
MVVSQWLPFAICEVAVCVHPQTKSATTMLIAVIFISKMGAMQKRPLASAPQHPPTACPFYVWRIWPYVGPLPVSARTGFAS